MSNLPETIQDVDQLIDSEAIDKEYEGILKLDNQILILMEGSHWHIDEETLKDIVSDTGIHSKIKRRVEDLRETYETTAMPDHEFQSRLNELEKVLETQ